MAQANAILPPFSTPLTDSSGMVKDGLWLLWLNQIYQILYANLQVKLSIPNNTTTAIAEIEPSEGDIVFDSTLKVWKGWNGSAWVTFDTTP